jgi:ankyrin repeat protein
MSYDREGRDVMLEKLIEAIRKGDANLVRQLLHDDPSLASECSGEMPLLRLAAYNDQPEIAQMFADAGAEVSFWDACVLGKIDEVRSAVDGDASKVNMLSPDGFTPAGLAAFFRQGAVLRFLVDRGADVRAQAANAQRVAPIHASAARQDIETVRFLIERGADVNARQAGGFAPLHTAAFHGDRELAETLLAAGADPSQPTDEGATAHALASERGHADFAEWIASREES